MARRETQTEEPFSAVTTDSPRGRRPDPVVEPEAFLAWSGWSQEGGLWSDPLGSNGPPEQVKIGTQKTREGKEEDVYQTRIPPLPWSYPTTAAVELQLLREAEKG